jgi:hypothetical protein
LWHMIRYAKKTNMERIRNFFEWRCRPKENTIGSSTSA